jgi:UDP-N-acetylglucosamine 2-epimerase (non-hydrolysing)
VVGARPNFMKVAPVMHEMAKYPQEFEQILVHTGQHYDTLMSRVFFEELGLPRPDVNLEVGSGSYTWQTAQVMLRLEPVFQKISPDWVVVVGDVNSTLACALVCGKMGIRVAHVEAGLRSYDRSMPEEINRLLTDQISDLLFTPSGDADENLLREGVVEEKIHLVGNVMIDTLVRLLPKAQAQWPGLRERFGLQRFLLVTLHRPSNVDEKKGLKEILEALSEVANEIPVLFPVHPRTRQRIHDFGLQEAAGGVRLLEPFGYLDFLALQAHADLVLTDSGGIQEETTYLGVPCLTARPNTERPVTILSGTNQLVGSNRQALVEAMRSRLSVGRGPRKVPPLWDGHTAKRIVQIFLQQH